MITTFKKNAAYTLCMIRPTGYTFCMNVNYDKQENGLLYFYDTETIYTVSLDTKQVQMDTTEFDIVGEYPNMEVVEYTNTDHANITNIVKGWQF